MAVKARGGRAVLDIEVQAAPWVDAAEVRLIVNGERRDPPPPGVGDSRVDPVRPEKVIVR